ncbi:MAG: dehydrogenase [Moraxellaceae bacterium]|nr:MAG: dehydrogenase [Moraxellaceae bacterium]
MEATRSLDILESLNDKNILITGTTGFLGKVVLEKLIREISSIKGVYLLIRGNKEYADAISRFQAEVMSASIFTSLRLEDKAKLENFVTTKIHCITGEISQAKFGLDNEEYNNLTSSIDLIINGAASVNFREEIDSAIKINVCAVENIADFSLDAGNIPVIHISTCYVNGFNKGRIKEKISGPAGFRSIRKKRDYYDVQPIIKKLLMKAAKLRYKYKDHEHCSQKVTEWGLKEAQRLGWNDTYTLTKWMAEQRLIEILHEGTLTILRPSIIESTLKSPVPGWIEGVKVADAIILAYARGKVRLFPAKANGVVDIIPADLVANAILISAAEACKNQGQHRIYQCCTGSSNPLKIKYFHRWIVQEGKHNHQQYDLLFHKKPNKPFILVNRKLFRNITRSIDIPISLLSNRLVEKWLSDQQIKEIRNIQTTIKLSNVFSFYTSPNCIFYNDKLMALSNQLSKDDQQRYPVNSESIHWETYIKKIHLAGLQRYALKPKPQSTKPDTAAKKQLEVA